MPFEFPQMTIRYSLNATNLASKSKMTHGKKKPRSTGSGASEQLTNNTYPESAVDWGGVDVMPFSGIRHPDYPNGPFDTILRPPFLAG